MSRNAEHCSCAHGHQSCVMKVPIFLGLGEDVLADITTCLGHKHYEKGDLIFLEGEPSNTLNIINTGEVKLFKDSKDGKQQIFHILSEGDFFGELALFKVAYHTSSVEALSAVDVCTLTKENLDDLIMRKPRIAIKLLEGLGERLNRVENMMQNIVTQDTEERIAGMLLELAERYGQPTDAGIVVELSLTREEMANWIGVSRETMSRKLGKLQDERLIRLEGSRILIIIDQERLEEYAL